MNQVVARKTRLYLAAAFKATVRGDDDSIREVIKGTRPKRRLTADDEDEVD